MGRKTKYNEKLKEVYGFDSLKHEQYKIIDAILHKNKDVCAILATGYGKSICYQFPYIYTNKTVIVISPLISLMEDQMYRLKKLKIPVCCLNGNTKDVYNDEKFICKNNMIVFMTPEYAIESEQLIKKIYKKDRLLMIAIDESHCISSWGFDFRPSYTHLNLLKKWVPNTPILALTATASEKVRTDIIEQLHLNEPKVIIGSFDRPNLFISVSNNVDTFIPTIKSTDGPKIIYCKTRKDTDVIQKLVKSNGINCVKYHAGMSQKDRTNCQDRFISGKVDCIIATVAFGLGIDVSNVRLVVHYGCPSSLNAYYQEMGRGGRDGQPSKCHLIYFKKDISLNKFFTNKITNITYKETQEKEIINIERYLYATTCRRKILLEYFGEETDYVKCNNCDNCLEKEVAGVDVTDDTIKIYKTIQKFNDSFGAGTIIKILTGSNAKNISASMKKFKLYNSGVDHSVEWWKFLFRHLVVNGYLNERNITGKFAMSVISLTDKFISWFENKETMNIYIKDNSQLKKPVTKKQMDINESTEETYRLFNKGLTIDEIAKERNYSKTTIEEHLAINYKKGKEINLSRLDYDERIYKKVKHAIKKLDGNTSKLKSIKDLLPETITYLHIKLAIAQLNK